MTEPRPTWRKPAGIFLMLLFIALWAALFMVALPWIERLPFLVQLPIYVFAGVGWIWLMKPLLGWMETGKWGWRKESCDQVAKQ